MQVCLFCGGDANARDHAVRCDGRQGHVEAGPLNPRSIESLVRPGDPDTSWMAAETMRGTQLRILQERVLALFQDCGPMTQHTLIVRYRDRHGYAPESTIRTRCAELVEVGLVIDTDRRERLPSGRHAVIWRRAS